MHRRLISGTGLVLAACAFIAVNIIANATLTRWRLDLTEHKLFTLSPGTLNILADLEEPITLRFYFSQKQLLPYPQLINYGVRVRDLLQEYAANSGGPLQLTIIDPEPFSDEEDQAVSEGLQSIPVSAAGEQAYFGLVGTNSTDDTEAIPFFAPAREGSLEYDISKLIYNLAHPDKRVIGVISGLPLFRNPQDRATRDWSIIRAMREFFEVRDLGARVSYISRDIEVLMLVHPKNLDNQTLYAIDQFALKGGKLLVFIDPMAEGDTTPPDPANPMAMPDRDSELPDLFKQWGIRVLEEKLAGDIIAAMRVQHRGPRGAQEVQYLPWLALTEKNFNQDDFTTSELRGVNLGTSGIIEKLPGAAIEFTPLFQTSPQSMLLERDLIIFQRDPSVILDNFVAGGQPLTLAARLSGRVETAFPHGQPVSGQGEPTADDPEFVTEGDLNAIVVADTDLLSDNFWIREQDYFAMRIPQPIADNGSFVINALENLSGNTDLISLRSRGQHARPFEVVNAIQRAAEARFREREQQLQKKLEETEKKIAAMQQEQGKSSLILSPEQAREIEKFRQEQLQIRKELRQVKHDLQKDIERLGARLRFINIGLIPLLIGLFAIGMGITRVTRRPA
jgi:ABC-type uncharacterized transport system involved in gliding motility auxiliary subunit